MKRRIKKVWLPMLLTAFMMLDAACSSGDADYRYAKLDDLKSSITYEGEWTVNKQVVDTAQMVVYGDTESMFLTLPAHYLLSTYIIPFYEGASIGTNPDGNSGSVENVSYKPWCPSSDLQITAVGYSETTQYYSIISSTQQYDDVQFATGICYFSAMIDSMEYVISLLSEEKALAIVQKASGQWTLSIPVDAFQLANMSSSKPTVEKYQLPSTVTLYYNTKRKID